MEEEFWNRFLKSGQIMDYLYYKGLGICRQVMNRYEAGEYKQGGLNGAMLTGGRNCESNCGYWNGASGSADS